MISFSKGSSLGLNVDVLHTTPSLRHFKAISGFVSDSRNIFEDQVVTLVTQAGDLVSAPQPKSPGLCFSGQEVISEELKGKDGLIFPPRLFASPPPAHFYLLDSAGTQRGFYPFYPTLINHDSEKLTPLQHRSPFCQRCACFSLPQQAPGSHPHPHPNICSFSSKPSWRWTLLLKTSPALAPLTDLSSHSRINLQQH